MEVASGLLGTATLLAILPGGTTNAMANELLIPYDMRAAARVICDERSSLRQIDLGQVSENYFILRVSTGHEAEMVKGASRAAKDRLGRFAYTYAALRQKLKLTRYHLTLDGEQTESDGYTCIVANSGNLGIPGLPFLSAMSVSDGLLDVVVIKQGGLSSLFAEPGTTVDEARSFVAHWQVRDVTVDTGEPQAVQADGELWEDTPLTASVVPGAVRVIVP
jgi:diacylglycerol kinase family enzyme